MSSKPHTLICKRTGQEFTLSSGELAYFGRHNLVLPDLSEYERIREILSFVPDIDWVKKRAFGSITSNEAIDPGPFSPFDFSEESNWIPYLPAVDFVPPQVELTTDSLHFMTTFQEVFATYLQAIKKTSALIRNDLHLFFCHRVSYSADCFSCHDLKACYECVSCSQSERLFYSRGSHYCSDSYFLESCINCKHCMFCSSLEGAEYHIFNTPVGRDEYERTRKELSLHSSVRLEEARERFENFLLNQPVPFQVAYQSQNASGQYLNRCKDLTAGFFSFMTHDSSLSFGVMNGEHVFNSALCGPPVSNVHQGVSIGRYASNLQTVFASRGGLLHCDLCIGCEDSEYLFGCVGLKDSRHCILNQQCRPEEYHEIRDQLIQDLVSREEWGKMFPPVFSRIPYNASLAGLVMPLGKIQAHLFGYLWSEERDMIRSFSKEKKKKQKQNEEIESSLCEISGSFFELNDAEKDFYKEFGVPFPERAPLQRFKDRFQLCKIGSLKKTKCPLIGEDIETWYEGPRSIVSEKGFLELKAN